MHLLRAVCRHAHRVTVDVLQDVLGLWISCGESINPPALCGQSHGP
jgi:hypothetical protein